MYKLMVYTEEWISIHECWNPSRKYLLTEADFSVEGWQNQVVVRHLLFRASRTEGDRDRFIVLVCDGLDTLNLVESLLVRRCGDDLSVLLGPDRTIDEATAIHTVREECKNIDRLLMGAPGPAEATATPGGRILARYLLVGILAFAAVFVGHLYVQGQVEDVVKSSESLERRAKELLDKLSGKGASESFLERLSSVEGELTEIREDAESALVAIKDAQVKSAKARKETEESVGSILSDLETIKGAAGDAASWEMAFTKTKGKVEKRSSELEGALAELENQLGTHRAAVEGIKVNAKSMNEQYQRLQDAYALGQDTLRGYREELDDLLSSSRSAASTIRWQSTCWGPTGGACFIFVASKPSESHIFPEFYKYQLRVIRQHGRAAISLMRLSKRKVRREDQWRYLKLWFGEKEEDWYKVRLEEQRPGEYRFNFHGAQRGGSDEEVTVEDLVREMEDRNRVLVVPMTSEFKLSKDGMFFSLDKFTISYAGLKEKSRRAE